MPNNTNKDWTGNAQSMYATLCATNHSTTERAGHDYYATEPKAIELLMDLETFEGGIWECACGEGHLSEAMKARGYDVLSTDLIARGYEDRTYDFLSNTNLSTDRNIITNPPYKYSKEFILKALEIMETGKKLALFLPIRYLESKGRRKIFDEHPPKTVYISSGRIVCGPNGDFDKVKGSAQSYAWYIWEKGHKGDTILKWFN